jgi:hypothetical protein
MLGMTLLHLRDDGPRGLAGEGRLTLARAVRRLRAALRTMHCAIVAAKLQRLRNEPGFQIDGYDGPGSDEDAARYPQQPLILGDKWDF